MRVFDWVCPKTQMKWRVTEYLCLTSPPCCQYLSSEFSHLDTSVSLFHFLANLISSNFSEAQLSFVHIAFCKIGPWNSEVKLFWVPCLGRLFSKTMKTSFCHFQMWRKFSVGPRKQVIAEAGVLVQFTNPESEFLEYFWRLLDSSKMNVLEKHKTTFFDLFWRKTISAVQHMGWIMSNERIFPSLR